MTKISKEGDLVPITKPSKELQIKKRLMRTLYTTPLSQLSAIAGLVVMILIFGAWSFAPKIVETKYMLRTRVDTFVRIDTVVKIKREVKTFVVDKSWGNKTLEVQKPTNKKNFVAKDDKGKVVNVSRNEFGFSRYEMMMWSLKTEENFRTNAYPDGQYYSIGFGFNMSDNNYQLLKKAGKLHLINGWGRKATITWDNAVELTGFYIDSEILSRMPKGLSINQQVARAIKAYNTGNLNLGPCCKGKSKSLCKRGMQVHINRRNFELQLDKGKITKQKWEQIRQAAIAIDADHKK